VANRPRTRLLGVNHWLLTGRLVLALFSLMLSLIVASEEGKWEMYWWVFRAGIAYLVLDFVYLVVTRWMKDLLLFVTWQLVGDLALAATFLYLTGGVDSPFYYLLIAVVMAGAMVLSWRRALIFTVAAVSLMWFVTVSYVIGWGVPDATRLGGVPMAELWVTSLGRSAGLLAVGVLTMILSWRLVTVRLVSGKVLESAGEGMLVVDGSRKIMYDNGEFRALFGLEERVEGEPIDGILGGDEAWLIEAITAGQAARMERRICHKQTNEEVPVRVVLSPLGGGTGMVVRFEDMSVEKKLEEAERTAEQYRLVAHTARSIAHEVRNPLASLSVAIQELMRGLDVPAERKDLVNVIRYEVGRIDRIIEEFMTLSRIRPPAIRLAAVRGVVEEAVSLLSHTEEAVANKSEIEIDAPFDLTMRLDADHLRQILLNVGLNSLQAGSKRVTIRARSTGANGAGIIEVIDNGPGMTKEVLGRMFEPFFTTRTRGTGLGCSVVRKMVEDHHGKVEVESEPGKGTLFRIFFPGNVAAKECPDAAEET